MLTRSAPFFPPCAADAPRPVLSSLRGSRPDCSSRGPPLQHGCAAFEGVRNRRVSASLEPARHLAARGCGRRVRFRGCGRRVGFECCSGSVGGGCCGRRGRGGQDAAREAASTCKARNRGRLRAAFRQSEALAVVTHKARSWLCCRVQSALEWLQGRAVRPCCTPGFVRTS